MAQEEKRCKYCGAKISRRTMCSHCIEKLERIRIIKAMILGCTIKEVIEREQK